MHCHNLHAGPYKRYASTAEYSPRPSKPAKLKRRTIRTTNLLERLFGEERRRIMALPHAFGERPLLKLMFAVVMRASAKWRGLKVTAFDRQQLQAIRKELDEAFDQRKQPAVEEPAPSEINSTIRT